eukprot:gb/GECH01009360.1/.p1 GENE.gb/GECH01009360.1/~~gb/GECH01009360.1/.p1  ORF type:complete len:222 (+),score=32.17 gb/GECH01009360.1/:1-666(+)
MYSKFLSNSTTYFHHRASLTGFNSNSSSVHPKKLKKRTTKHSPFVVGHVYKRQKIHDRYGGNRHAGISPCSSRSFIFLFTDFKRGSLSGYNDKWEERNEIFIFTGEEQKETEFRLIRGNSAVRNHVGLNKSLLLFNVLSNGYVKYIGEMIYRGHFSSNIVDRFGQLKTVIKFRLAPLDINRFAMSPSTPKQKDIDYSNSKRRKKVKNWKIIEPLVLRTITH